MLREPQDPPNAKNLVNIPGGKDFTCHPPVISSVTAAGGLDLAAKVAFHFIARMTETLITDSFATVLCPPVSI